MSMAGLPRWLLAEPDRVVAAALAVAHAGTALEQVTGWNSAMTAERHVPDRLLQPLLDRVFRRFTQLR